VHEGGTGRQAQAEAGGLPRSEIDAERSRLASVIAQIDARLHELGDERQAHADALREMRRDFWEDFKRQDDWIEAAAEAEQQRSVLAHKTRQRDRADTQTALLRRLRESPYFGRVDLALEDETDAQAEPVYLGIASFRGPDGNQRVYDWRAPVASVYYDAVPGPVAYEAPAGTVQGRMLLKRQFQIAGGRLDRVVDSDLTVGDDLLLEALSQHGDVAMRTIVSTIQAEQNRAIRDVSHPLVVVVGSAGSGKTSVAMQRVAFLLYHHRDRLDADQVVLFSPNPLFASYVSTVLPDLGERNMHQVTFQEYLERRLGTSLRVETSYEQLEALLSAPPSPALEARRAAIAHKASAAFLAAIRRFAESLGQRGMVFRPLVFRGRPIVTTAELEAMFADTPGGASVATRVQRMAEQLAGRLRAFAAREAREDWPEDEFDLVDTETQQAVYDRLAAGKDDADGAAYYKRERDLLARGIVERDMGGIRAAIEELRFVDTRALYLTFLESAAVAPGSGASPQGWSQSVRESRHTIAQGRLRYEDATPLLYLNDLVRGRHASVGVRHVVVDEAQDYTHCQLDFLHRAFPFARFTLLGDPDQALVAGGGAIRDLDTVRAAWRDGETAVYRLGRSYRPTRQIAEFTRRLLPHAEDVVPFDRPGSLPVVTVVPTPSDLTAATVAAVAGLRAQGCGGVAVITRTQAEAARLHARLSPDLGAHLLSADSSALAAGVAVLPGYLAKGLEFDGVVVYDASATTYATTAERGLLYAAVTRAMHGLRLVAAQRPTPLLDTVPPDLYRLERAGD